MPPKFGSNAPKCPTCSKSVYAAEEVKGPGGNSWHALCFCCKTCGKSMRGGEWTDNGGEPYCKACHGKSFGPKGIGFGVLGDTGLRAASVVETPEEPEKRLSMKERMDAFKQEGADATGGYQATATAGGARTAPAPKRASFQPTASPKCPVCGKSVYLAEEVKGPRGQSWHQMCFCCKTCSKSLRGGEWRDNDGEPYCASCHSKCFGPKGIGYGSTLGDTGGGQSVIESMPSSVGMVQAQATDSKEEEAAEQQAAERRRIEAEEQAKNEAEEQEAAERARIAAEEQAKKEAEEREAAERARVEAEEQAKKEAEEKEAAERARVEAEEQAKKEAEEKETAERARVEAEAQAKKAAEGTDAAQRARIDGKPPADSALTGDETVADIPIATEAEVAVVGPCSSYRIDVRGVNFGDCKCGFGKKDHQL